MPQDIGGKSMVGEISGMFDSIKKAMNDAKMGIAAAGAELMTEVNEMKAIEGAIRSETASVREFKTRMLGNAIGGENLEGEKG